MLAHPGPAGEERRARSRSAPCGQALKAGPAALGGALPAGALRKLCGVDPPLPRQADYLPL